MSNFDVYIGLDFGTSFSKVCYNVKGDLYVYKRDASPYIPTEIYYSKENKEVFINKNLNSKHLIPVKYFKYSMVFDPIIDEKINKSLPINLTYKQINIIFSIYFLACLVKEVKHEIIKKYYKNINTDNIKWEINMSAPIDDYHREIYDLYNDVLNSAYILASEDQLEYFHIDKINEIYNNIQNNKIMKNDILSIHPELFVEAVYFTENNIYGLDYGSYMIMDIGGGTVDIGILWKRKWSNTETKYDLIVISIIQYGVEKIVDELKKIGIGKQDGVNILVYGKHDRKVESINDFFIKNIKKMIEIEGNNPKTGIDNINDKRIYYAGGGCSLLWYKNIVNSIKNNRITEDIIPINLLPLNYDNKKQDVHRLIIAMELANPVDKIERNLGTTIIINGEKIIPGDDFSKIEIIETCIIRNEPRNYHNDLQDRQRDIYGDNPI